MLSDIVSIASAVTAAILVFVSYLSVRNARRLVAETVSRNREELDPKPAIALCSYKDEFGQVGFWFRFTNASNRSAFSVAVDAQLLPHIHRPNDRAPRALFHLDILSPGDTYYLTPPLSPTTGHPMDLGEVIERYRAISVSIDYIAAGVKLSQGPSIIGLADPVLLHLDSAPARGSAQFR